VKGQSKHNCTPQSAPQ